MAVFKKYIKKREKVDAVKLSRDNLKDVISDLIDFGFDVYIRGDGLKISRNDSFYHIRFGMWLVFDGSSIDVLEDKEFNELYDTETDVEDLILEKIAYLKEEFNEDSIRYLKQGFDNTYIIIVPDHLILDKRFNDICADITLEVIETDSYSGVLFIGQSEAKAIGYL